jgi:hypothetical protein
MHGSLRRVHQPVTFVQIGSVATIQCSVGHEIKVTYQIIVSNHFKDCHFRNHVSPTDLFLPMQICVLHPARA